MRLGADPGIDGALTALYDDGRVLLCEVVPTVPTGQGSRREYDRDALRGIFGSIAVRGETLAGAVELQHAFPATFGRRDDTCPLCKTALICEGCGSELFECPKCLKEIPKPTGMKGSIANFKQGAGMEMWISAFFWNGILKPDIVSPKRWQSYYGIKGKRQGQEAPSIAIARELFPSVDLRRSSRAKVDHSGKADSLLIAEWSRRMSGADDF